MLVYQPLETKDLDTGKWYKIWEITQTYIQTI